MTCVMVIAEKVPFRPSWLLIVCHFVDREQAIRRAIELAEAGDIVLIAGKGHEKTQEFAGNKLPFDDVAIAARAISNKRGGEF